MNIRTLMLCVLSAAAALLFLIAPSAYAGNSGQTSQVADGCYNGVLPLQPYVHSCSLPPTQPHVQGAAPDTGAILACHHHPGCLSWYVNSPH